MTEHKATSNEEILRAVTDLKSTVSRLDDTVADLKTSVELIKVSVADSNDKITDITKPDTGLYARVRDVEHWKTTASRFAWLVITALVTLVLSVPLITKLFH